MNLYFFVYDKYKPTVNAAMVEKINLTKQTKRG